MRKIVSIFILGFIFQLATVDGLPATPKQFKGNGEVTSVDPFYGRITIKHGAIKDFSGDGETEFIVSVGSLLKEINKRDLVDFTIQDDRGDVRLVEIKKTGVAPIEENPKLGKVVQDVLVGTGEVVKGVTDPLPPAHEVVSGAVGATTSVTGAVLPGVDNQSKQKF